jgi:hypothetical protein
MDQLLVIEMGEGSLEELASRRKSEDEGLRTGRNRAGRDKAQDSVPGVSLPVATALGQACSGRHVPVGRTLGSPA